MAACSTRDVGAGGEHARSAGRSRSWRRTPLRDAGRAGLGGELGGVDQVAVVAERADPVPAEVVRKLGCAFSQVVEPVVE